MKKNTGKFKNILKAFSLLTIIVVICTGAVYDSVGMDITVREIDEFGQGETVNVYRTRHETVSVFLEEHNIPVELYDKVNMSEEDSLTGGDEIVIRRGTGISIEDGGTLVSTSSTHSTVGEALAENGYFLEENDYPVPSADSAVTENMRISVVRVDSATETKEEKIPFETIYKDDSTLYEGEQKVSVKGITGVVKITEEVIIENGAEVSRTEVSRETVTEKRDEVILKGTKKKEQKKEQKKAEKQASPKKESKKAPESSSSSGTTESGLNYKKKMTMTATAYSAFKKGGGYGTTASGRQARYGVVAVDPKVIPLGTNLYVEGYGYAVAADTGGAIKGNKIDLCFEKSNSELMKFGRQTVTVYILD